MNVEEVIGKTKDFTRQLSGFVNLTFNNDKDFIAKGLKDIIEIIGDNRETMKEVFLNMKICFKNEARIYLQELDQKTKKREKIELERKVERIKSLVNALDEKIKILSKSEGSFRKYLDRIDIYSEYLKGDGKKGIPKKVEADFKRAQMEIIGILNVLGISKEVNDFEKLISTSKIPHVREIERDERYLKNYSKSKYFWISADRD